METQKTSSSQSNLEKESQSWRNQDPLLQTTLQSHHDSMVLAQKQKYRSVKLDGKLRDKPTHLWSPYLKVTVTQSCLTLCNLINYTAHGIL